MFALGTRLTRITRELATHDPDAALAAAAAAPWPTGRAAPGSATACGAFNDRWGVRGLARGAVVVSCPTAGTAATPRSSAPRWPGSRRVAHRLVWVNPLKAAPGYAPLARGMAAALPHVDEFVEGHSVGVPRAALAEVLGRCRELT